MVPNFEMVDINEDQISCIRNIEKCVSDLAVAIDKNCKDGRMKSLAFTKLEECAMWANKSISHEFE